MASKTNAALELDGLTAAELFGIEAALENGDALDVIHEYIEENARRLYEETNENIEYIENGVEIAEDLEEILEYADPAYYAELVDQANQGNEGYNTTDAPTVYRDMAEYSVAVWFEDPRATDALLREEAENLRRDPHNLFKAGTFDGLARMTAATIIDAGADRGVGNAALTAAIYKRYGIAY